MDSNIIITVFLFFVLFIIIWFLRPIVWKNNLENFLNLNKILDFEVEKYVSQYLATQAVHDLLVGDVSLSVKEYNHILMDGCVYVVENLTKHIRTLLLTFYTKVELQEFIITYVNIKIDETYTISSLEPIEEYEEENGGVNNVVSR